MATTQRPYQLQRVRRRTEPDSALAGNDKGDMSRPQSLLAMPYVSLRIPDTNYGCRLISNVHRPCPLLSPSPPSSEAVDRSRFTALIHRFALECEQQTPCMVGDTWRRLTTRPFISKRDAASRQWSSDLTIGSADASAEGMPDLTSVMELSIGKRHSVG